MTATTIKLPIKVKEKLKKKAKEDGRTLHGFIVFSLTNLVK